MDAFKKNADTATAMPPCEALEDSANSVGTVRTIGGLSSLIAGGWSFALASLGMGAVGFSAAPVIISALFIAGATGTTLAAYNLGRTLATRRNMVLGCLEQDRTVRRHAIKRQLKLATPTVR